MQVSVRVRVAVGARVRVRGYDTWCTMLLAG